MRIRIGADLILLAGLFLGYVSLVLGTYHGEAWPVCVGAGAMLLCAGLLADRGPRA